MNVHNHPTGIVPRPRIAEDAIEIPTARFAELLGEGPPPASPGGIPFVSVPPSVAAEIAEVEAQPAQAEIFNEDGFFDHPATAGEAPGEAIAAPGEKANPHGPAQVRKQPVPLAPEVEFAPPQCRVTLNPDPVLPTTDRVGAGGRSGSHVHTKPPVATRADTLKAGVANRAAPPAAESEEPVEPDPVAHRAGRRLAERAARNPVSVAIAELEQGLHVVARVEAIDPRERERLHDAIRALLARHGLSSSALTVSVISNGKHVRERMR